jgi:putative salt-induced outer membrane protein YdiY
MKLSPLFALAAALAHGGALAGDVDPAWTTSAELGAITTSGNTAGTAVTGKIDARQELDDWSNQYIASGFFKEDEKTGADGQAVTVKSAERFSLSAKAAYKLMEDGKKLFVLGTYVDDKFGAYTTFSTMAVGHAWGWDNGQDGRIDLEIGPGYFSGTRANGEDENGFTVRGAAALRWRLSPSAMFSHSVSVERGTSNVHSIAEAALSTKINDTMQMKAAFVARNDTNVPSNKKNTDTQTSVTLVYSF